MKSEIVTSGNAVGFKVITRRESEFFGPSVYLFENTYKTFEEAERSRLGMKKPDAHEVVALIPVAAPVVAKENAK